MKDKGQVKKLVRTNEGGWRKATPGRRSGGGGDPLGADIGLQGQGERAGVSRNGKGTDKGGPIKRSEDARVDSPPLHS